MGSSGGHSLVIRSNSGGTELEIGKSEDGGVSRVRLTGRYIHAERAVYGLQEDEVIRGVGTLFTELAADWRGWDGERDWSSLEGDFRLSASHDGLGTVELIATLAEREPVNTGRWSAQASLSLDAGTLDQVVHRAAAVSDS